MKGLLRSLSVLAPLVLALASVAHGQGTRLWTQSDLTQLEKGTPDGVELRSDGQLRQGAGVTALATTPSTYVWSVAVDKAGLIYAGTGSPATILRINTKEALSKQPAKPFTLFETKDLTVQALRLGPDGNLYAALLPSGRVLRLNPAATAKIDETAATVVFDPTKVEGAKTTAHSHYVWDLTFDAQGRLYIATGDPAAVYRVELSKPNAKPEEFFKTDEAHVRSLAWDAKGNLIAGTDGSGLVYRIDPSGKGYVLFEAPRREVTSVAVAADGTIYAACVGDKTRISLPPLPVAPGSINIVQPGSLAAANSSASLPDGSEIYALAEGQAPRKLWAQKDEIVYALLPRADGLMALTGNHGHVLRIAADGSFADLAHLDAQQVLSLVSAGDHLILGTGNTGRLFAFGAAEKHEYASQVFDAGALARFGRVEIEPGAKEFQILTRTGNLAQPARGWADWQLLKDGVVASPAGRYLQWKAVLNAGGVLANVGVNYLPVNAAPVVDDVIAVPGARWSGSGSVGGGQQTISIAFSQPATSPAPITESGATAPLMAAKDRTAVTVRWAAHDDNGDELTFAVYLRGDGESVWRLLKDRITDHAYSFDATQIPDGGYQVKVLASDAPSHTPGDALTAEKISPRFEIDTTPPVVSNLRVGPSPNNRKPALTVSFDAEDASSPIIRAEYSLDAGPWQYMEPVGKLSDARRESYSFPVELPDAKPAEHLLTVRVYDRHDNVGLAKIVIPAEAK
jgi:hypothetical protein